LALVIFVGIGYSRWHWWLLLHPTSLVIFV